MAFPSVTYTFANSTTADATQVNQNYSDIINGLTDTTKDLSVNNITGAGNLIASGAITLGASTSNAITINGALASVFPIQTNTTYDFGSSQKGLLSLYIGGASTNTIRLLGSTVSASYTLTLPTSAGTTGQFPVTDGTGVLSFRYPDKALTIQTANLNATGSETFIPVNGSGGAFTYTLPAAASFIGKRYTIFRTDSTLANLVTIARAGSDTFTDNATTGATSVTLNTQGESIDLLSDGVSIWYVLMRKTETPYIAYTPTVAVWTTNITSAGKWRRRGNIMDGQVLLTLTGGQAGSYTVSLPSGVTIDTAQIAVASSVMTIGDGIAFNGSVDYPTATLYNSTTVVASYYSTGGPPSSLAQVDASNPFSAINGTKYLIKFSVPISGWAA